MNVIGIGTDIVECLRVAKMIEKHEDVFIQRVYTPGEIEYCGSRKASTQHYAGHWAAKEAVLRALGTRWRRGVAWRDIEIRQTPERGPTVALRGGARELVEDRGVHQLLVTIAHCRSHATAYVVALGDPDDEHEEA